MEPQISILNLISNHQELRKEAQNYLDQLSINTDKFLDMMFLILEKGNSKQETQLAIQLIVLHINSDHYRSYTFEQYKQKRFPIKTLIWKFTTMYEKNQDYHDQLLHLIEQLANKTIISQHQNYYFLILEKLISNIKYQKQQVTLNNIKSCLKLIKLLQIVLRALYKRNCRPNYHLGYSLIDFLYKCQIQIPEIQQARAQIAIMYMRYQNMFQLSLVTKLFRIKPAAFASLIYKKFIPMYRSWHMKHCKVLKLKNQDKHKAIKNPLLRLEDCKYDYEYNILTLENAIIFIYSSQFIQLLYEDFRGACKVINMIYEAFLIFFQLKPKNQLYRKLHLFSETQTDKLTKRVLKIIHTIKQKYKLKPRSPENTKQKFDQEQQQQDVILYSQSEVYQLLSVFVKQQQQYLIKNTIKELELSIMTASEFNEQHFIVFQFFAHFYQNIQFLVDMHKLAEKCVNIINNVYEKSVHSLYSFLIQHIKCQTKQSNYHKVNRIQAFIGQKLESMGYSEFVVSVEFSIENSMWNYFVNILPIFFDGIDQKKKLHVLESIEKKIQNNSNLGEQVLQMFQQILQNTYSQCSLIIKAKYLSIIRSCLKNTHLSVQNFMQTYNFLKKIDGICRQQKGKTDFDEQIIKEQYFGILLELYKMFNERSQLSKCSFFPLQILRNLQFTKIFLCIMQEIEEGNNFWSGNSLGAIYNKLILQIIAKNNRQSQIFKFQEKKEYQSYCKNLFTIICNQIFQNKKSFLITHLELFIALHEEMMSECVPILSNILSCLQGTFQYYRIYQRLPPHVILQISQNKLAVNSQIILSETHSIVGSDAYDMKNTNQQLQAMLLYASNHQIKWYLLGYLNFIAAWVLKYSEDSNQHNDEIIQQQIQERVDRKKQFYTLIEKLRTKNIVEKTEKQHNQSQSKIQENGNKEALQNWEDIIQSLSNCSSSSNESQYISQVQNNEEVKLIEDLHKLEIQDQNASLSIWPGTNRIFVHYLATLTINGQNNEHWIYPLENTSLERWSRRDFKRQQLLSIVRGFTKYL